MVRTPRAVAPPLPSLAPGTYLGKYELLRLLAIGGMAEVYLARAHGIEGFQKRVVLKRVLPQLVVDPSFVAMFLDEARLAAMLDHPNIVQVYDIASQAGSYFLTMEYVRGQDARNIVKHIHRTEEQLPLECAVAIGLGVAAALHYAHEVRSHHGEPLGIVHRDVSLSNVLVSYDGAVKIVDFGIAKVAASDAQTQTGTLKGKVAYMSPEQCRGERLDRRSDIFSLGIVLYELVTGARLFTGRNEFAILQQIVHRDVEPPSSRRNDIPPELDAIILQALRRDRDERYATARELERALEAFTCENKLSVSPMTLADYMATVFADEIAAEPSDSNVSGGLGASASDPSILVIDGSDVDEYGEPIVLAPGSGPSGLVNTAMFVGAAAEIPSARPMDEADAVPVAAPRRRWSASMTLGRLLLLVAGAVLTALVFLAANLIGEDREDPQRSTSHSATEQTITVPPAETSDARGAAKETAVETDPDAGERAAEEPGVETNPDTDESERNETAAEEKHRKRSRRATRKRAKRRPHKRDRRKENATTWDSDSALLPGM